MYIYRFKVFSSRDGAIWNLIVDKDVLFANQVVTFERRKMQFVKITLYKKTLKTKSLVDVYKSDLRYVHAALM